MALIDCKDCGNQISDSAAACPKCGSPIPRTIGPDEEQCPHCMTVVSSGAWVCSGCRAKRGYTHNGNVVYGRGATIGAGVVLPVVGTLIFPPAGLVLVPLMIFCIYRLIKGPVWYQTTGVH